MSIKTEIISGGYDDSGSIDNVITEVISREKEESRRSEVSNHYLLRSRDELMSLKSNFLVNGIPLIAYGMMNAYKSRLEKVPVVTDGIGEEIFDCFVEYFHVNEDSERFVFVPEGKPEEWSPGNTVRKAKKQVGISEDELVLVGPADLIFGYDLDPLLLDPDNEKHEIVWNLNSFDNIYGKNAPFDHKSCAVNRRWHLRCHGWNKEGNFWAGKPNEQLLFMLDLAFSARKTYNDSEDLSFLQWTKKVIDEKNLEDNLTGRTQFIYKLMNQDWTRLKVFVQTPEILAYGVAAKSMGIHLPICTYKQLSRFMSTLTGLDIKLKASHGIFGYLPDVDSVEDLAFNEMLMRFVKTPDEIYPFWNEFKGFGDYLCRQGVRAVAEFHEYFNEWCDQLPGLRNKKLYDKNGAFLSPELFPKAFEKVEYACSLLKKGADIYRRREKIK